MYSGGLLSIARADAERNASEDVDQPAATHARNPLTLQPGKSCPARCATNVLGAMPIPTYEGRRTHFFFADVEPKELMTFGVEAGIQLDDDSTLEVLGHALAYWAIAEERDVLTCARSSRTSST
jgi:hypothetical protein